PRGAARRGTTSRACADGRAAAGSPAQCRRGGRAARPRPRRSARARSLRTPRGCTVVAVSRILSDAAALLVFVTIGLLSHHGGVSASGYARDALPFLGCWFAAAYLFGLYRRPTRGALLRTWVVGVTAGVVVRQLVLWSFGWDDLVFLMIALCFTLL